MQRSDGRKPHQIRPVTITTDFIDYPEGSCLIEMGNTRVLCNATLEESVPRWMKGSGKGWITAEYSMLPRSTHTRTRRETSGLSGRTQEIKRLIGRSLRAAFDLSIMGERMCIVDCDVLQADGGTRTAAITGSYVAVALALQGAIDAGKLPARVLGNGMAAISVGVVSGNVLLDLCYSEDSKADVDANIVMTASGKLIEVQGTAEGQPFSRGHLNKMLDYAEHGIAELIDIQKAALGRG